MVKRSFNLVFWLVHLFDPPPLASMGLAQKIGRILGVALTLVIICILTAIVAVFVLYVIQRGKVILSIPPDLQNGLGIIFAGICVNVFCVKVLLELKRADLSTPSHREELPERPSGN